jgi:uncharacterized repeat protein (TIGR01451 family)
MAPKHMGWSMVLIIALSISPLPAVAGSDALIGTVEAYRVATDRDGKDAYLSANEARPKDVIEYRLTYKNTSETAITNVSIIDPIPFGMRYVAASATDIRAGRVEFSINHGKSFHGWPVMRTVTAPDGTKTTIEATPDMVTHVRWVMAEALNPAKEITVSYRASVK